MKKILSNIEKEKIAPKPKVDDRIHSAYQTRSKCAAQKVPLNDCRHQTNYTATKHQPPYKTAFSPKTDEPIPRNDIGNNSKNLVVQSTRIVTRSIKKTGKEQREPLKTDSLHKIKTSFVKIVLTIDQHIK